MIPGRLLISLTLLALTAANGLGQVAALSVNTAVREEVRQFYRAIYHASHGAPMGWTGSYTNGTPGDTTSSFKEATRLRINFYRALVGVPADITFEPSYNLKAQRAALMTSANDALSHTPPSSWRFYTAEGAEAAGNSNLALGSAGANAIDGYVADAGTSNRAAGHRRWLFYPQTLMMGAGDVPGSSTLAPANAVWVIDSRLNSARPTTRSTHVAYPPAGYVPYTLVWPRWSFSYPGADFAQATVTMRRNGTPIAVAREPLTTGVGEPTLVWVYDGRDSDSDASHPRPGNDITYTVNIGSVRIGGVLRNFEYNVTVFDPDQPSAEARPTTIVGASNPAIGRASTYAVITPAFGSGFEWRTVQVASAAPVFTAEQGLEGLIAQTTPGYTVVQSHRFASGGSAYRLAHTSARASESLRLPGTYLASANSTVTFQSRLGVVTDVESAHVQVSVDGGVSWLNVFSQAGTSSAANGMPVATENAFVTRSVSLADFAGRTIALRLTFAIEPTGSAFLPDATNDVGWFIDTLALSNVQRVTASEPNTVANGNSFTLTPGPAPMMFQARGLMFGYPMEWGPVTVITPMEGGPVSQASYVPTASYLSNLSVRTTAGAGAQTLIVGFNIKGGSKPLLLRGIGPSLAHFGIADSIADPTLGLFRDTTRIGENDNWLSQDVGVFAAAGAFQLPVNSRDAAIATTVAPGAYTLQLSSAATAQGTALVELYDAAGSTTAARITNLSARSALASATDALIAGFSIAGNGSRTLLIRAVGPALSNFGVPGALMNPKLQLFDREGRMIQENDNWDAAVAATFERVGAFQLPHGSQDAALLVTLPPGSYTAQVTGVDHATGVTLVEVYDVP